MSLSDSETQSKKRIREASETEEVFHSVFGIFMDFANKAETIVSKLEGFDNAGEAFKKLPPDVKKEVLKELWGEIAVYLLERLPEEGKEAFLVRCFDGLYHKLAEECRKKIDEKVKDALSSSRVVEVEAIVSDSVRFPQLFQPQVTAGFIVENPDILRPRPRPSHPPQPQDN